MLKLKQHLCISLVSNMIRSFKATLYLKKRNILLKMKWSVTRYYTPKTLLKHYSLRCLLITFNGKVIDENTFHGSENTTFVYILH